MASDQATGACAGPALPALKTHLDQGEVGVYGVLVGGADEARIQVTFTEFDADGSSFPNHCVFPNHPGIPAGERGAVSVPIER